MAKLVELSKQKIREGRREPRTQKELLVYLIYIEMLGHDTAWAQATAIQLCSDKNLAVKKVGFAGLGRGQTRCRARAAHKPTWRIRCAIVLGLHQPCCHPSCTSARAV